MVVPKKKKRPRSRRRWIYVLREREKQYVVEKMILGGVECNIYEKVYVCFLCACKKCRVI